jgi:O-antigen/teichoic acid export membrane protein
LVDTLNKFAARIRLLAAGGQNGIASYMLRGVSTSFLLQGFGLALVTGSSVLLARLLGAANYGIYSYVLAWIEILKIPVAYGLPIMVQREVAVYAVRQDWPLVRGLFARLNQFILAASTLIIALAVAAAMTRIAGMFDDPIERRTLYIALVSLPIAAFSAIRAATLNGLHLVGRAAFPDQIVRPSATILAIGAIWVCGVRLSAETAMIAQVTGIACAFVLGAVFLWRALPASFATLPARFETRTWLRDLGPFLLHGASYVVWASLAVVMLGWYRSPAEVGVYRAAALAAGLSIFPITAFVATVSPLVARLYAEGDRARIQKVVSTTTLAMFAFGFCGVAGYALIGRWLLDIVFGVEFRSGYWPLVIIAGGNWVFSGIWSVGVLLDMSGNQRFPAVAYLGALVLNLVFGILLIPPLGLIGAAISTAASWAIAHAWLAIIVTRRLGIRPDILRALTWGMRHLARR